MKALRCIKHVEHNIGNVKGRVGMKAIEFLEQFKTEKSQKYSQNTMDSYIADLKQFFEFIGKDLEELNKTDLDNFIAHVLTTTNKFTGKALRPQTVNKKLIALRQFIEWLNANTDIKIHTQISLLEIQKQEYLSEDLLTSSEFERLVKYANYDDTLRGKQAMALFYGLYYTGMRISELLSLKVHDLDKLEIWVKGKGGKFREIPITNKLKPILQDYVKAKDLKANDYVYTNVQGNTQMSRQTAHRIIKKYAGKAKIKLKRAHVHNLRHLFCLNLLAKGATLEEVADLAGHSNINTTRIYIRKTKQELRSTVEKL